MKIHVSLPSAVGTVAEPELFERRLRESCAESHNLTGVKNRVVGFDGTVDEAPFAVVEGLLVHQRTVRS